MLVVSDSSGDISFKDVGENFIVERDSSGDISATRIGGDFRVERDGSGEIDVRDVKGTRGHSGRPFLTGLYRRLAKMTLSSPGA